MKQARCSENQCITTEQSTEILQIGAKQTERRNRVSEKSSRAVSIFRLILNPEIQTFKPYFQLCNLSRKKSEKALTLLPY